MMKTKFNMIRQFFQEDGMEDTAMNQLETVTDEVQITEQVEAILPEAGLDTTISHDDGDDSPVLQEADLPKMAMDSSCLGHGMECQAVGEESELNGLQQSQPETILELSIGEIQPNPFQPRIYFDPAQLEELANSIREYGVLQPVTVRLVDGSYQLVSGERRFRASVLAGKETIPALVRSFSDREVAELALIENLQREDLNYFEEAEGYARLIQEFHITQEEVAKKMGKSQPTIANKLRLLHISERVRREISVDVVTERHVRSLLKLKNEDQQLEVLHRIYKNNLNVRQTDDLIETLLIAEEKNVREQKKKKMMKAIKDMKIFVNTIKGTVKTIQDAGMPAEITEHENEEYLEVVIRLPKKEINQKDLGQKDGAEPERGQRESVS